MGCLFDISHPITRHAREGLTTTALPGVWVLRAMRTTQPIAHVQEPTFALVAGGVKHTVLSGEVHRYGTGEYLVTPVDLPLVGHIVAADHDEPLFAVAVRLNLRAGIEREILWRLLTGPLGATIRQIGIADSRHAHLGRAIRRIRDHYGQPLRVPDLAATATMSRSSFHRHFLALTSMTPLEYRKQLRLNEARIRLLTGNHEVAAVGFSVGYSSPSQFSREYRRRMFGTTPSQTGDSALPAPA